MSSAAKALRRRSRIAASVSILILTSFFGLTARAQSATNSVPLQWFFSDQTFCGGYVCDAGCPGTVTIDLGEFTDPLPPNSKLISASFSWLTGNDISFSWQGIPTVALVLDGTLLSSSAITNSAVCNPNGAQTYTFTSADYPDGFPGYNYSGGSAAGSNALSLILTASNGGVMLGDNASLTLTYAVPPPIEFNVTDSAPVEDRRIILSNSDPTYPYPYFQSLGGKDAQVPMSLLARGRSGQYQEGLTVYLRVTDPEDTAPYMNLTQNKLAHPGDNNGPLPTLVGSALSAAPNTVGVYQATSGSGGEIDFTLQLQPGAAAGDNYAIEASFDPTFPSGASWRSAVLTAWKRILIEKHNELKNGIALNGDSNAGDSVVLVASNSYGGNQGRHHIRSGDRIILVHAPALDRRNLSDGWYSEEHTIADVTRVSSGYAVTLGTRNGKTLVPEFLQHPFGLDPTAPNIPAYADSIAKLSGATLTAQDYFDAPDDLIDGSGNPFSDAFVEYHILPDGPFGFVPMPRFGTELDPTLQTFGEKWCMGGAGTNSAPNHQLLVVGDSDMAQPTQAAGVTVTTVPGQTSSWVWRGTIDQNVVDPQSPSNGGNPDLFAAKVAAHELTHEFKTNAVFTNTDHCPALTVTYNDPKLFCMMSALDINGVVEAQYSNGIARFHLLYIQGAGWHSEYFGIRKYPDPFVP